MHIVPDPDNRAEMWMVGQFLAGIARADMGVFVAILFIALLYALGLLLWQTATNLFEVYSQRLREVGPHVRTFWIALILAVVVALIGIALLYIGQKAYGMAVLAAVFGLLSVFTSWYDWYLDREEQVPELEGVTLDDIVAWQGQVNKMYDAELA